jgi:hypothetical protein
MMSQMSDRRFDWVAGLAYASGAAVMLLCFCALAATLIGVAALLI